MNTKENFKDYDYDKTNDKKLIDCQQIQRSKSKTNNHALTTVKD